METKSQRRWVLVSVLAAAVVGLFIARHTVDLPAEAQAAVQPVSDGRILVLPVQVGRDSYGIAMVDTVAERLWVYEISSRTTAHNRLRLLAARSWQYDKLLDEYNTADPKPRQVKELLEKLSRKQQSQEEKDLKELFELGSLEVEKSK